MQTQFDHLQRLATQYSQYYKQPNKLFEDINALPEEDLQSILKEYGDPDRSYQPVNLLRAEMARLLLKGDKVNNQLLEEIKQKIREKDTGYFSSYSEGLKKEMRDAEVSKRDLFANWQKPWSVLHVFFYRDSTKQTVKHYLNQIGEQLLQDLQLKDYTFHAVDFQGANNFGSDRCWIALYPVDKISHQEAHQFFLNLTSSPEAGGLSGGLIKGNRLEKLKYVGSYEESLLALKEVKEVVFQKNATLRSYFKFAPGAQAYKWQEFYEQGIIAISYSEFDLGDLSGYDSLAEINFKAGMDGKNLSNQIWNLWLFRNAKEGDVVFASLGVSTCLGIGVVEGPYYYDAAAGDYPHRRRVNWITDQKYQYKAHTVKEYKNLFRVDTFSPTKMWEFILAEYLRLYPELEETFRRHHLLVNPVPAEAPASVLEEGPGAYGKEEAESAAEPAAGQGYWWLNANPTIWSITSMKVGESQTYTARNERGNKRRVYKYFQEVKPGDLVIGYESSPAKKIIGLLEITKSLYADADLEERIAFTLTEKLEIPVAWSELVNHPGLQQCEVVINNQGSLFKLTEEEFEVIRDVIDHKTIIIEKQLEDSPVVPYAYAKDPDKPFISGEQFSRIISLLRHKKNIILQGPPGVGKTFVAQKLAYEMMGEKNDAQIEMVQFHQSYAYEDFIQGLRPGKNNSFELRNGAFFEFCQRAILHPEKRFFFIIDEINRGNLSKVFGELLMLLEADKRKAQYAIRLTYAEADDARFYIPSNLYLIGTMNTADRSLAIVDYALRRRFAFVELEPAFDQPFKEFLLTQGLSEGLVQRIREAVVQVNREIVGDVNLGSGFQIGHSYFCSYKSTDPEATWYRNIIRYEVKPLLEEIWFDNRPKVEQMLRVLEE